VACQETQIISDLSDCMKGLVGAIIQRTKYGTWKITVEIKTDRTRIKVLRKLRLMGIYVMEKDMERGDK